MKISLNVSNDQELRDFAKGLMEGQVKSILRSEIKGILQEMVEKKWFPQDEKSIKELISEASLDYLKGLIKSHWEFRYESDSSLLKRILKESARELLFESLEENPQAIALLNLQK